MAKIEEDRFWKDFLSMADYFSPAINPIQKFLGVSSKEIIYILGKTLGNRCAERLSSLELKDILSELSKLWKDREIGRLEVKNTKPLTLVIYNCAICGQLPGTGNMFNCAFHEGFFEGLLSTYLKKEIKVYQETNFEGPAGTWCRRYIADISL
ncbi:MAG: hypothetical protein QXX95_06575 [Nitrososphaerales archaeon]